MARMRFIVPFLNNSVNVQRFTKYEYNTERDGLSSYPEGVQVVSLQTRTRALLVMSLQSRTRNKPT
jgi:hypothetical protein